MAKTKRQRITRGSGIPIRTANDFIKKFMELGLSQEESWKRYGRMKLTNEFKSINNGL